MFSCPSTAQDYQLLKKEILVWCDLSIHQVAAAFHGWNYDPSFTPRSCQNSLLPTTRQLLQVLSFSSVTLAIQVMEQVVMTSSFETFP